MLSLAIDLNRIITGGNKLPFYIATGWFPKVHEKNELNEFPVTFDIDFIEV